MVDVIMNPEIVTTEKSPETEEQERLLDDQRSKSWKWCPTHQNTETKNVILKKVVPRKKISISFFKKVK